MVICQQRRSPLRSSRETYTAQTSAYNIFTAALNPMSNDARGLVSLAVGHSGVPFAGKNHGCGEMSSLAYAALSMHRHITGATDEPLDPGTRILLRGCWNRRSKFAIGRCWHTYTFILSSLVSPLTLQLRRSKWRSSRFGPRMSQGITSGGNVLRHFRPKIITTASMETLLFHST